MSDFIDNSNLLNQNIKKSITKFRKQNGLHMRDVARALNMNENTYRMWEDVNRSCPKIYDLYRLARLYGVSVDTFLNGEDDASAYAVNSSYNGKESEVNYFSTLDRKEKLMIMSMRTLSSDDRQKLNDCLNDIIDK